MSYVYRLNRCKGGSERMGACEVCGKSADTVYLLTQQQAYKRLDGTEGLSGHNCFQLFGHKQCLANRTI